MLGVLRILVLAAIFLWFIFLHYNRDKSNFEPSTHRSQSCFHIEIQGDPLVDAHSVEIALPEPADIMGQPDGVAESLQGQESLAR